MVGRAKALGLRCYGVSDHFDYDYLAEGVPTEPGFRYIDETEYFRELRTLQKESSDSGFRLLAGGEFGFSPKRQCAELYAQTIERHRPDFIVNSVHSVEGHDVYFSAYFDGKTKRDAYARYLDRVRESLDAPYRYEIVGHLGYVSRNAPYADRTLRYEEFPELLDEILRTVIAKGKILEVNSSARGSGGAFLPDCDILARYRALGGEKVSYGSDAHRIDRIGEGREEIARKLKGLGFCAITVPEGNEEHAFPL